MQPARFTTIRTAVTTTTTTSMSKHTEAQRTPLFLPPVNRTMRVLDRSFFVKEVPLVALKLEDPSVIGILGKSYKPFLLQQLGVGHVVHLGDRPEGFLVNAKHGPKDPKGVLLSEEYNDADEAREKLSQGAFKELMAKTKIEFVPYKLKLTYDFWKGDEILAAVLPEEMLGQIPGGFAMVGHVAHLNIRDHYLPYKHIIGQVVLDKNARIRTVVNKLDTIHTLYRTFDMEVLAGEEDFMVEQSESNCRFRFDFSKVYWNSRLHTEHERIITKFQKGQAVCDPFAGVGPFSIPAGKKQVLCFASDLNPESHKSLVENIALNKVGQFVKPYCADARTFIRDAVEELVEFQAQTPEITFATKNNVSRSSSKYLAQRETIAVPKHFSHYVMNLPDTATSFLDSFIGIYSDSSLRTRMFGSASPQAVQLPMIHVHCFYKYEPNVPEPAEQEIREALRQRVSGIIKHELDMEGFEMHNVRKVAPTKNMYCLSFELPLAVALGDNA